MKYSAGGVAGAASTTAATAGIGKLDNPSSAPISPARIVEFSVTPGGNANDTNYAVQAKDQSTAGTWTSVTPNGLDPGAPAAKTTAGRISTAAGTAGSVRFGPFGFNQRGGMRWVAVQGCELEVPRAVSNGLILEYVFAQSTDVNYFCIVFDE